MIQPSFVLLDEPFAGIDPIALTDIQKIIFHLKERRIGVLITDHNVRETLKITDRAHIVHDGTIFRSGTQMFGYFEADDLESASRFMAEQEVSTRWQDAMAELLQQRVPDGGAPVLEEIFRLDE